METSNNQPSTTATTPAKPAAVFPQAVTGLTPPQLGEAMIREVRPTGTSAFSEQLIRTGVLAPLGLLLMAGHFLTRILPFVCKRYTLTNKRLMIQKGLKPSPAQSVDLADIDEVRLDRSTYNRFYH